jgi:hypothetical protein
MLIGIHSNNFSSSLSNHLNFIILSIFITRKLISQTTSNSSAAFLSSLMIAVFMHFSLPKLLRLRRRRRLRWRKSGMLLMILMGVVAGRLFILFNKNVSPRCRALFILKSFRVFSSNEIHKNAKLLFRQKRITFCLNHGQECVCRHRLESALTL